MILVACTSTGPDPMDPEPSPEPMTMRERLATRTHLRVTTNGSAGSITAQRKTSTGWDQDRVALEVNGGELVASTDDRGSITLGALESGFETVTLPPTLLGREAQLTNLHLHLSAPVDVMPTWSGDDEAQANASLDLELSWSLAINGTQHPLGEPRLSSFPVKLQFTGDATRIAAEVRVHAPGELWNWADLLKLSDFDLLLDTEVLTHAPGTRAGARE